MRNVPLRVKVSGIHISISVVSCSPFRVTFCIRVDNVQRKKTIVEKLGGVQTLQLYRVTHSTAHRLADTLEPARITDEKSCLGERK